MSAWVVWKFELPIDQAEFTVPMPAGYPLSVQVQNGVPVLWAVVMPETADAGERRPRRFTWVATGQPMPESIGNFVKSFLGTLQLPSGIVLHLFQVFEG